MQKVIAGSALSLGALGFFAACTEAPPTEAPPTGQTAIEIRRSGAAVAGSSFQCTGSWPSHLTPCGYDWNSQPITRASAGASPGLIDLSLGRVPLPVDGGASMVVVELQYGAGDPQSAAAKESTTSAGTVRQIEASDAISGWVDPVAIGPAATGPTADVRYAGRFSLTFPWGSISGTYDTVPNQGP